MTISELFCESGIDANVSLAIYSGIWNDGGTCLFHSHNDDLDKFVELLDRKIKYITTRNSVLVLEVEDEEE